MDAPCFPQTYTLCLAALPPGEIGYIKQQMGLLNMHIHYLPAGGDFGATEIAVPHVTAVIKAVLRS